MTQEELRQRLSYDPITGLLTWRYCKDRSPQWNGRYAGIPAGSIAYFEKGGPYIVINLEGKPQLAHRLIWLYVYGYMPEQIDHKDCDGMNNVLTNLREATQSQNNANRYKKAKGHQKHGNKYRARIKVNGIQIVLGSCDTPEEAEALYKVALIKYFGEFANV